MSILPSTTHEIEREMDDIISSIIQFETPLADLWDADKCPEPLLIYLAWALSVDVWNDDWSEQVKRDVCRKSLDVHRLKGTAKSMQEAVDALGYHAILSFSKDDPEIKRGTFKVKLRSDSEPITSRVYMEIKRVLDDVKRGTLHLEGFSISTGVKGRLGVDTFMKVGTKIKIMFERSAPIKQDGELNFGGKPVVRTKTYISMQ